jgi:predicted deacetylase
VSSVLYLLVPNYHGAAPIERDRDFQQWCVAPRPFQVRWALHGHFHLERPGDRTGWSLRDSVSRRLLTAGEGEFLSLRGTALEQRLDLGLSAFINVLGVSPDTFIAPAWLRNDALPAALRSRGIRFTEDHGGVYDIRTHDRVRCPVITWSSRSSARRVASAVVAAARVRGWRHRSAIRVALHPHDFDHPAIVVSIMRTLDALMATHTCAHHSELFTATP